LNSLSDMLVERPAALRDQVVGNLRNAIINGQFAPGARLVERQMCELLGVSRTLVREALRQLEAEGWIRILPYRGPVVITMTPDEVRDLYEVRSALEGIAAQRAATRATPEQLDRLEAAVEATMREYGVVIYQNQLGQYIATPAVPGTNDSVLIPNTAPRGAELFGDYHTHGDYSIPDPDNPGSYLRATAAEDPGRDSFSPGEIAGIE
jgi:DNA-binding transcriptional regulator YhcF (GntR family)